ncbi:sigma-E processing peptidase SpoIIGA [Paenibacillus chartarius]|uniref:Sporulation sigma-E factor-processing peptidase n=1 Tax=Paenibacillus chartarius TaxID=747481 RepID=A0ABV6DNE3_9BACL
MIVYLDLIFLTNLLLNGAVLATTAWARHKRVAWWRIALSALLGAFYVLLLFLPDLHMLYTFAVKIIFSIVMIMTAFGFSSLQNFLRDIGMFYLVNFSFAGCIFGLRYFLLEANDVLDGIVFTQAATVNIFYIGYGMLFVFALSAIFMFRNVFVFTKKKNDMQTLLAEVRIMIGDVEAVCTGLIDTGNQLYDPLTRTPVMVMEADRWKEWLPPAWLERIRRSEVDQLVAGFGEETFVWQDRLRLVPFRGIGRGTQFMLALKPDRVVIKQGEQVRDITKVLIGLDGGTLSHDCAYQAIIHPAIIAN